MASDRPAGKRRLAVLRGVLPRRAGSGRAGAASSGAERSGQASDLRGHRGREGVTPQCSTLLRSRVWGGRLRRFALSSR